MKRARSDDSRRLIDRLIGRGELGPPRAMLATTFDLNPEFFELDFLPSLLQVPAWDDRRIRSRIQLESELARMDAAVVLMDGRRFQGRPRTLRVETIPAIARGRGVLHAKLVLLQHDEAVRMIVTSANLTTPGYRENREVALSVVADAKHPDEARLIRQALEGARSLLGDWRSSSMDSVLDSMASLVVGWDAGGGSEDERFVWGGDSEPLWQQVVESWPRGERIRKIVIVSPFWSEDAPGPLATLLDGLRERGVELSQCDVWLVTAATPDTSRTYRPTLPPAYAAFDFRTLGVRVRAVPAKPDVEAEDVGRDDLRVQRSLHAKVLLIEGDATSLAYIGSANFTVSGWGFGGTARSNIEAGVVMLRRGKQRRTLSALVPPTLDAEVELNGSGPVLIAPEPDVAPSQWPRFLTRAELRPTGPDDANLELCLTIDREAVPAAWSLSFEKEGSRRLSLTRETTDAEHILPLAPEDLSALLRSQLVYVYWQGLPAGEPVPFPINVSLSARDQLPFADPEALPREHELVAFYQGRIALEDVFPNVESAPARSNGTSDADDSGVDTSQIVSYQIRAFVEALAGISDELARATSNEASMRLALLGPVSPVALAREIVKSVESGRSHTAVGFQLAELIGCIRRARTVTPPTKLADAWTATLAEAERRISDMLQRVVEDGGLTSVPAFQEYLQVVTAEEHQ